MIGLCVDDAARRAEGEALAQRWGFALQASPQGGLFLQLGAEHLALCQQGPDAPGPVFVDFVGGAVGHRRRFGGGRGQPLAKAVGLKGSASPQVVDATAGLGRDAFVLASLGCAVTLVERSPVVAALLADGLARGAHDAEVAPIMARMRLVNADAAEYLQRLQGDERPDVVYLDPMYPHREKSALVKKEMRAFRELVGEDPDADRLLPAALAAARQRVVVKRPDYAEPLAGPKPTLAIPTKNHRFDVYVMKALPTP